MELKNVVLSDLKSVASAILKMNKHNICLLNGEMGSGKTTLIREVCEILGVEDNVASPTFSLVNEYATEQGPVYHFDFYRIKSIDEALDAGVEDYFYSGNLCLIEWPELVEPILPADYLNIEIDSTENDKRNYKLTIHESDKAYRV